MLNIILIIAQPSTIHNCHDEQFAHGNHSAACYDPNRRCSNRLGQPVSVSGYSKLEPASNFMPNSLREERQPYLSKYIHRLNQAIMCNFPKLLHQ